MIENLLRFNPQNARVSSGLRRKTGKGWENRSKPSPFFRVIRHRDCLCESTFAAGRRKITSPLFSNDHLAFNLRERERERESNEEREAESSSLYFVIRLGSADELR